MIPQDYITVSTTTGRIAKGILSIPVALIDIFPKKSQKIFIMFDDSKKLYEKTYSSYQSSTKECRINGIGHWFRKHNALGDEKVVITIVDKANYVYRLSFEDKYLLKASKLEEKFFSSKSDTAAENLIDKISSWTGNETKTLAINQLKNLADMSDDQIRKKFERHGLIVREKTPSSVKTLLFKIYNGHCQLCDFTFMKKDEYNYYEIHHIKPILSHSPKNLLVVCPNCHRQFEYSNVVHKFNQENWLVRVTFNLNSYNVKQALLYI